MNARRRAHRPPACLRHECLPKHTPCVSRRPPSPCGRRLGGGGRTRPRSPAVARPARPAPLPRGEAMSGGSRSVCARSRSPSACCCFCPCACLVRPTPRKSGFAPATMPASAAWYSTCRPAPTTGSPRDGDRIVVHFSPALPVANAPALPSNVDAVSGGAEDAVVTIAPGASTHDMRLGNHVVLDVFDPARRHIPAPSDCSRTRPGNAAPGGGTDTARPAGRPAYRHAGTEPRPSVRSAAWRKPRRPRPTPPSPGLHPPRVMRNRGGEPVARVPLTQQSSVRRSDCCPPQSVRHGEPRATAPGRRHRTRTPCQPRPGHQPGPRQNPRRPSTTRHPPPLSATTRTTTGPAGTASSPIPSRRSPPR